MRVSLREKYSCLLQRLGRPHPFPVACDLRPSCALPFVVFTLIMSIYWQSLSPLSVSFGHVVPHLHEPHTSPAPFLGEDPAVASLIGDQLKKSRRDRSRVAKYLGPPQRHLWEREEETGDSQGASLSCSTLTDCGDTADTGSESQLW